MLSIVGMCARSECTGRGPGNRIAGDRMRNEQFSYMGCLPPAICPAHRQLLPDPLEAEIAEAHEAGHRRLPVCVLRDRSGRRSGRLQIQRAPSSAVTAPGSKIRSISRWRQGDMNGQLIETHHRLPPARAGREIASPRKHGRFLGSGIEGCHRGAPNGSAQSAAR